MSNKIILSIIQQQKDEVKERCVGYRDEVIKLIGSILESERQNTIEQFFPIQKKINSALSDSARFLWMKRKEGVEVQQLDKNYDIDIGDLIRVIDGPFENHNGAVEDVISKNGKLHLSVKIFGHATPIELDFSLVTKYW